MTEGLAQIQDDGRSYSPRPCCLPACPAVAAASRAARTPKISMFGIYQLQLLSIHPRHRVPTDLAFRPGSDLTLSVPLPRGPFRSHHLSKPRPTLRPSRQCHLPASFGSTAVSSRWRAKRFSSFSIPDCVFGFGFDFGSEGPAWLSPESPGQVGESVQNVSSRLTSSGSRSSGRGGRG